MTRVTLALLLPCLVALGCGEDSPEAPLTEEQRFSLDRLEAGLVEVRRAHADGRHSVVRFRCAGLRGYTRRLADVDRPEVLDSVRDAEHLCGSEGPMARLRQAVDALPAEPTTDGADRASAASCARARTAIDEVQGEGAPEGFDELVDRVEAVCRRGA